MRFEGAALSGLRARLARLLCGSLLLFAHALAAQELAQPGAETREERTVQMSEQVYRRLTAVHDLLGEGSIEEAIARLEAMRQMRLGPYEEAMVFQSFGFAYAQQGRYAQAIAAFERCVELDALPNIAHQSMLYSLAGLYASEGRFDEAIETMLTWFRYAQEPVSADAYMLVGSSHAELGRLEAALPWVQEAIRRSEQPNESWHMLELSIHFEQMSYERAAQLLQRMVVLWPSNGRYWEMLASCYLELAADDDALATLMVAYKKDLLQEEAKILNLVRLNMFVDLPYEAGRILEQEMRRGRVEETEANLELLRSAWTAAREFAKAVEVIDRLAPMADDGEYYMQKAQLLNEQGDWAGIIEATERALEKGGLEQTGAAYVLMGMAYAELGEYGRALEALGRARDFESAARRNAEAWIEYVRDRQRVALAQR